VDRENWRPRLRSLEIIPTEHEGQNVLLLRDSLHLSDETLVVPMSLVPVLQRLDGSHTLEEIRREIRTEFKLEIPAENIRNVFSLLEQAHFLGGEEFEAWQRRVEQSYLDAAVRPSYLAGKSYDADPAALRSQIDSFFTDADGPGLPPPNGGAGGSPLRGLVAPHIDFQRGGPAFAWSYRALADRAAADVFVVLGTVHAPTRGMYTLTRKSFETPLGALEVDASFVDALVRRAPGDLFEDEFAQRGEHSIEFQAVFLRYLYPEPKPVRFVPVLVGSFGNFVAEGRSPEGDAEVEGFIEALKGVVAEFEAEAAGRRVCLLASVDLAHVGPQFGDEKPVDEGQLRALEEADRASLDAVCRGDAEAFYWSVAEDGDARNVCGLAPIYTMLRALEGCRGEVLRYSQWPDPGGTVTFCSVALESAGA